MNATRTIIRIDGRVEAIGRGGMPASWDNPTPLAQSQPGPAERHHSPRRFSLPWGRPPRPYGRPGRPGAAGGGILIPAYLGTSHSGRPFVAETPRNPDCMLV